jgi:hypothetical protein
MVYLLIPYSLLPQSHRTTRGENFQKPLAPKGIPALLRFFAFSCPWRILTHQYKIKFATKQNPARLFLLKGIGDCMDCVPPLWYPANGYGYFCLLLLIE